MANMDTLTASGNGSVGGTLGVTSTSALTGAVTTTAGLTVGTDLSVGGIGKVLYARKTADESVTSSTTLQDDNHMTLAVVASASYWLDLSIFWTSTSATPGIKIGWSAPSGATMTWGSPNAGAMITIAQTDSWSTVASEIDASHYEAILQTAGNAGNIVVQWAQDVSNGTATTVKAGSVLSLLRVA